MRADRRLHTSVVITRENVHPSKVKIRDKSFVVQEGRRSRVAAERRSVPNSYFSDFFLIWRQIRCKLHKLSYTDLAVIGNRRVNH